MKPLKPLFDSFWRAVAYCLRPDVLIFLLVPWVVVTAITLGWCYFYWAKALIVMQSWLGASESVNFILHWLNNSGLNLQKTLPSLVLIFIMIPLVARVSYLAAIGPGGATTMDSTLPVISRFTNPETSVIAFFSGFMLSFVPPVLIPLFLGWV